MLLENVVERLALARDPKLLMLKFAWLLPPSQALQTLAVRGGEDVSAARVGMLPIDAR